MMRRSSIKRNIFLALLLPTMLAPASAAQEGPPATALLPADAPIVLEIPEPAKQLGEFREYLTRIGFYESPAWAALQKNPGWAQARVGVFGIAGAAGMTPWQAIDSLVGDGLAITLLPGVTPGSQPRLLAVARLASDHAADVDRFLDQLNILAKVAPESIEEVAGGRIVRVNPELCYARADSYLIVGNEPNHVKAAVERAGSGGGANVLPPSPANARARLRVNLAALRQQGGPLASNEPMNNPLGGYLFGGWAAALRQGDLLHGWLASDAEGMSVHMNVAVDEPFAAPNDSFFKGDRSATAWRAADLPRALGEIRVDRDWARLFADREQILTLAAANGVANFSAGLTTLMGGLDFMDELLPRVNGPARLVAAGQDFSQSLRVPSPKLPAVALAIPLEFGEGDMLRDRIYSSALSALSLIGLNQGQNGQPQLMAKAGAYKDHQVIYAQYAAPMSADGGGQANDVAPVQYNFEPAVAIVGDELIVATTYTLLRDIIDLKEAAAQPPDHAADDVLWLDSRAVEQALRDNTEELIMNRMLEQNESREQATAMFEGIFQALRLIDGARIISRATDDGVSVTLTLGRNDPSVEN